jgi:chromosome segregation ATPase
MAEARRPKDGVLNLLDKIAAHVGRKWFTALDHQDSTELLRLAAARIAELEREREIIVQASVDGIDDALREGMQAMADKHAKVTAERDAAIASKDSYRRQASEALKQLHGLPHLQNEANDLRRRLNKTFAALQRTEAERDALRATVRGALEDCTLALENLDDGHCPEGAANIDDATAALRAALEGK